MNKLYSIVTVTLVVLAMTMACNKETEAEMTKGKHPVGKYANHLANENSPYLLSHADNPVNWYPWGKEALNKAKEEDKPIFLSIGYAACHWCHVMEHESFENEEIAGLMNKYFVSIKVDREQRPDLDEIYMAFTTAMTGSGGWPMSVFLTPDLKPFYAGTYFPAQDSYGRPGFGKVLTQIGETYRTRKDEIIQSAESIYNSLRERLESTPARTKLDRNALAKTAQQLYSNFDQNYGGFGRRPKFPHANELSLFLLHHRRSGDSRFLQAAELALKNMARGGIYDQIGGGFARYSTDERWLVPHFEKMLYDNALLVPVYAEAFQITKNPFYLKVVRETLDFMMRELLDEGGGYYSSLDADSEGEEGKFYVWSVAEIQAALGDKASEFIRYYNVTSGGNFEGHNILNVTPQSDNFARQRGEAVLERSIAESRRKLLEVRSKRVRPLTDDKILASWNGLAISAFCRGYQVTQEGQYLEAAVICASFIRDTMYRNGVLTHSYRKGSHSQGQFLEDYAYFVRALIDMFETDHTGDSEQWLSLARELAGNAIDLFQGEDGRFYLRPAGQEDLVFRPKEERDGSIPAAGSLLIGSLLKLHRITGDTKFLTAAEKGLEALSGNLAQFPAGMASLIFALDYYFQDKIEIVLVGDGDELHRMLKTTFGHHIPNRIVAFDKDGNSSLPLFEGRFTEDNQVRAYVCRNSVCRLPVSTAEELKSQLDEL